LVQLVERINPKKKKTSVIAKGERRGKEGGKPAFEGKGEGIPLSSGKRTRNSKKQTKGGKRGEWPDEGREGSGNAQSAAGERLKGGRPPVNRRRKEERGPGQLDVRDVEAGQNNWSNPATARFSGKGR